MVKPHLPPRASAPAEKSALMTDDQFEDFWIMLYSRGAFPPRHPEETAAGPSTPSPRGAGDAAREENGQRGRSSKPTPQRCGTCRGCIANDCGQCKNCRDKTKCGAARLVACA